MNRVSVMKNWNRKKILLYETMEQDLKLEYSIFKIPISIPVSACD